MTLTEICALGALATTIILLLLQLGRRSAGWDRKNANGRPTLGELERRVQNLEEAGKTTISRWFCDERHKE